MQNRDNKKEQSSKETMQNTKIQEALHIVIEENETDKTLYKDLEDLSILNKSHHFSAEETDKKTKQEKEKVLKKFQQQLHGPLYFLINSWPKKIIIAIIFIIIIIMVIWFQRKEIFFIKYI